MILGFKGLSTVQTIRLPGFLYDIRPTNSLSVALLFGYINNVHGRQTETMLDVGELT